jgi:hypothetical protein
MYLKRTMSGTLRGIGYRLDCIQLVGQVTYDMASLRLLPVIYDIYICDSD